MNLFDLCKEVPKIELHAHINGSLSDRTLTTLGVSEQLLKSYHIINNESVPIPEKLQECFKLFKVAHEATSTIDAIYTATKHVIEEFHQDNVVYLELRTTPRQEKDMTKREYIEAVVHAIQDNKNPIVVKLILSIDRRHGLEVSEEALNLIIEMHKKHPDIVKGVDLCGNPSEGTFYEDLFMKARKNGLKVTLHCGEVKNDEEVFRMLKFKPERIGHGIYIHPDFGGSNKLWELYNDLKIPTGGF